MKQKKAIVNKLRTSGLRPTKQRILIAQNLFERNKTFVYFSTQFAILAILFLYKEYTGEASIVMKSSLLIIGLVSLVLLHFKVFWREDLKFIERIKK